MNAEVIGAFKKALADASILFESLISDAKADTATEEKMKVILSGKVTQRRCAAAERTKGSL